MAELSDRDRKRLAGVHPDLVRVAQRAKQDGAEFLVIEGLRTKERQEELVAQGRSQTMFSRHLTGHAMDLGATPGGVLTWAKSAYVELAEKVKTAAKAEGVPLEWGGDWKGFFDGPHFQLPHKDYPERKD